MGKKKLGEISRYFSNIGVAAIKLDDTIKTGQKISIEGATTNFEMETKSLEIDRESVDSAKAGQEVALKVPDEVREGDAVYLLE